MLHGILSKVFKAREKVARDLSDHEVRRRRAEDPDWDPDEEYDDEEKPFLEHLEDLRSMLLRIVVTLVLATVVCFGFHRQLTDIIKAPLVNASGQDSWDGKEEKVEAEPVEIPEGPVTASRGKTEPAEATEGDLFYNLDEHVLKVFDGVSWHPASEQAKKRFVLNTTEVTGVFMMSIKVALFSAIVVSFPFLIYFFLQFVLPGLKRKEKRVLWPSMAVGFGLFVIGVVFAYTLVLPRALEFFHVWAVRMGVDTIWTIEKYVTFTTRFLLVFGISFELPVLVMALVKIDILNYSIMKGTRRHAIVAILIFAAIVTPTTDPGTLLLLSVPMCLLYEICIWIAYYMEKRDRELYPELYEAWDSARDEDNDEDPWEADDPNDDPDDYDDFGHNDYPDSEREEGERDREEGEEVVPKPAAPVPFSGGDEDPDHDDHDDHDPHHDGHYEDPHHGEDDDPHHGEDERSLEEIAHEEEDLYGSHWHNFPKYTKAQLMEKELEELVNMAEELGCPSYGDKEEVVQMILDHL